MCSIHSCCVCITEVDNIWRIMMVFHYTQWSGYHNLIIKFGIFGGGPYLLVSSEYCRIVIIYDVLEELDVFFLQFHFKEGGR